MKRIRQVSALVGAPVLMAVLLLAGSGGFRSSTKVANAETSTLNKLSDKIDFTGVFVIGGTHFAIYSTTCTLHDLGRGTAIPCFLGSAGALNVMTSSASADVTITGPDGTITFHQTATRGCATGTGIELDHGSSTPVPVRVEGISHTTPVSPTQLAVTGSISVYEQGGGTKGISCLPD